MQPDLSATRALDFKVEDLTVVLAAGASLLQWKGLQGCFSRAAGFSLLSCTTTADEVLTICDRLRPLILVIDQQFLDQMDPVKFLSFVDERRSVRVLVKLDQEAPETVERLLRIGCAGFVGPSLKTAILRRAVRSVAAGELWVSRRLVSKILHDLLFDKPRKLTERELEVLNLIGQSRSNQEIADQLNISRETVRWHLKALYAKIGVRDRVGAVQYARAQVAIEIRPPEPPLSNGRLKFPRQQLSVSS